MRWASALPRPAAALCLLLIGVLTGRPLTAQQIWFSPQPRLGAGSDYMDLFHPDAPWQQAASHVAVFEIGGRFLITAPQADLQQIFSDLQRRHIGVQIGVGPLSHAGPAAPANCGYHVEGYSNPNEPLSIAMHVKALGGDPQYFGMDEPLYFGHVFGTPDGKHGCHSSIADIAQDVANKVRAVRTVFPGMRFGDVEPLTFQPGDPWFQNDRWLSDLGNWFDAYQAAVGDKLAFLRLDMWWTKWWQPHMPALIALLKQKGIPLQVIYNGSGQDRTDPAWIAGAIAHFKEFESGPWPRPAAAVFQYWTPIPTHALPESDPLTATGLIDRYVQWQRTRH